MQEHLHLVVGCRAPGSSLLRAGGWVEDEYATRFVGTRQVFLGLLLAVTRDLSSRPAS